MLQLLTSSPFVSIQDTGRHGWQRLGVPVGGAMDGFALRAANALVGNDWNAAALEIGPGGAALRCWQDGLLALTGCGVELWVNARRLPAWMTVRVPYGALVELRPPLAEQPATELVEVAEAVEGSGSVASTTSTGSATRSATDAWWLSLSKPVGWSYLAFSGGIDVPAVLGSRSSYPRAGLGPAPLQAGDVLPLGAPASRPLPGRWLPPAFRPAYSTGVSSPAKPVTEPVEVTGSRSAPLLDVIPGPQLEHFAPEALQTLCSSIYSVRADSDRMGCRLSGPALRHIGPADILSDGMVPGSVQVPASGQPIVMLADCPTTGGYPKIAVVSSASLPLLAQCAAALGQVRFRAVSVEDAQAAWRALLAGLKHGVEEPEESEL